MNSSRLILVGFVAIGLAFVATARFQGLRGQQTPAPATPAAQAPGQAPGQAAPGQPASGQAAPGQAAPGQAAPGQAAPGQAAPDQAAPDQAVPESAGESTTTSGSTATAANEKFNKVYYPLIVLAIGIAVVLGLIIVMKVNAFIALITAAMVVSFMAPGDFSEMVKRVASAFGGTAGGIGIVIALAAVIGKCMLDSGAADRIVRAFVNFLGEKQAPIALMGSGYVLAVPVFFDTVFYLLVPLARSLHRRTGVQYLKYILAIAAGGALTHSLVPPTPGPLLMASTLNVDLGVMILVGAIVALPAALAGVIFAHVADKVMQTPMRSIAGVQEPDPLSDEELPSLWLSLSPVLLPVLLISTNTVLTTFADLEPTAQIQKGDVQDWPAFRALLRTESGPGSSAGAQRLWDVLSTDMQQAVAQEGELSDEQKAEIRDALNASLSDKSFYNEDAFVGVRFGKETKALLKQSPTRMRRAVQERKNRLLIEDSFNAETNVIKKHEWLTTRRSVANFSDLFGNANLALLLSTIIAMWMLVRQRGLSRTEIAGVVEQSLMSGGVIILITAGGGAFGAMLQAAQIGGAIEAMFGEILQGGASGSMAYLFLGFAVAAVLKVAQGSGTVAMIVGSSMMAAIVSGVTLDYHTVYLATAIGSGSLVGSWMNDSGFWIFAKMGGLTEPEALKSWTLMLIVLGVVSFGVTLLLASVLPLQ